MTREQKQQARDVIKDAVNNLYLAGSVELLSRATAAIAILDDELSKPEEREWAVRNRRLIMPFPNEREACGFASANPDREAVSRVKASRTPAGPWEPTI